MHGTYVIGSVIGLAIAMPAAAQTTPRAEVLTRLSACRATTDSGERLRCFDRESAALEDAERKKDIVVVDRAGIRAARRSLFGLTLPSFRLFGDGDKEERDEPEFNEIKTTVKRAERNGNGALLITLEDGARWMQSDSVQLARDPRPGTAIRIRRAALGSFLANIGSAPAIRVRRVN